MIAGAMALVFLATLTVISCNSIGDFGKIHEGRIVYSIEYPKDKEQSSLVTLLPETMELKFKEDNTVININGFFAIFSLIYISDHNTHTNYSLLRVMNQKKMYKADTMEIPFGYEKMHNIQIKHTDDTLTICGYKCKKALAYCPEASDKPYELYYTNEIGIRNPNTNNPFRQLDGVLLGFQVRLSNISMNMKAIEIHEEKIDDSVFKIPDDYEIVSREQLEEFIDSFTKSDDIPTI